LLSASFFYFIFAFSNNIKILRFIMTGSLKYLVVFILIIGAVKENTFAQQYTSKKIKAIHQEYTDSLKNVEYNYIFPIWGQQAYKKGFDIPYPAGIMANYMWMRQGIVLENMQLGLKTDNVDIPLTDVSFIEFGDNYNESWTANIRADLWLLPFLNVYGIFGYGNSNTEVNITYPLQFTSVVNQGIRTTGFGVMTAFGIGPVWMSVDANWTWNKPDLLDKPVKVNVLGLRLGHTFKFKKRSDRNIAIWGGAMRAKMNTETSGEIRMADALPASVWERRDEFVNTYWDWYESLDPNNVIDKKKIDLADEVLTPIVDNIEAKNGDAVVRYGMDKQVKEMWNGIFGAQFQLNKRWMFRAEAGLIGDRKSILGSVNYRFLI